MRALLVIDMQKEYIDKYIPNLVAMVNSRIQNAVKNNEMIFYVKNMRMLKSGNMSYDFAEGLDICSDNILFKSRSSIFSNSLFVEMLEANKITEIDFVGIDGCCCVASSACDAVRNGYKARVLCDYVGVQNDARFEKKQEVLKKFGVIFE